MTIPFPSSVKTVDKFGVAVTGSQGQGPLLQPKIKHRFRVLFLGFGGAGNAAVPLTLNTNKCGLPSVSHEEMTVHSYNSRAYFMGKHEWSEIELEVRDTVDNSVTKQVGAQVQMQMDHYNQTGYRAGQDYKFTMMIQTLEGGFDSSGASWTLEGCWLKKVTYGEVDYSSSEGNTISMSVRYDNAILEDSTGINSIFPVVAANPLGSFLNS